MRVVWGEAGAILKHHFVMSDALARHVHYRGSLVIRRRNRPPAAQMSAEIPS